LSNNEKQTENFNALQQLKNIPMDDESPTPLIMDNNNRAYLMDNFDLIKQRYSSLADFDLSRGKFSSIRSFILFVTITDEFI
jgi:hypothetical protein